MWENDIYCGTIVRVCVSVDACIGASADRRTARPVR